MNSEHRLSVSVCMITYNQADTVRRAVESVLAQQTGIDFELVISDDGSEDGTDRIVEEYATAHPSKVSSVGRKTNVGMHQNSLWAESHCRGGLIAYCEGDDWWHNPAKLEMQCERFHTDPGIVLVFSDFDKLYESRNLVVPRYYHSIKQPPPSQFNVLLGWGTGVNIQTCTVMLRAQILREVTCDDRLFRNPLNSGPADIARFFGVSQFGSLSYINESLATYNVRTGTMSRLADSGRAELFSHSGYVTSSYLAAKQGMDRVAVDFASAATHASTRVLLFCGFRPEPFVPIERLRPNRRTQRLLETLSEVGLLRPMLRLVLLLRRKRESRRYVRRELRYARVPGHAHLTSRNWEERAVDTSI